MARRAGPGGTDDILLTIGGQTYGVKLLEKRGAYAEKDVNAFSPKITTGELGYSSLDIWSVIAQADFRHGFGHRIFDDPSGYHYTEGSIDTRHKDVVQLATAIKPSDEDLSTPVAQFMDYKGYVWAVTGAGLRVFDPNDSTWAACSDTLVDAENCVGLLNNGTYLFVARYDSGTPLELVRTAAPGSPNPEDADFVTAGQASAKNFQFLVMGGGRMWANEYGKPYVHFSATLDGSDWEGDANDPNRTWVGPGDIPITAMCWFQDFLYVAREDGLWAISPEEDPPVARQVMNWSNERRTTDGAGMMVWKDKLIIPIGPQLIAFTGRTVSNITPPAVGHTFPYQSYGNFASLATFGPYLYVAGEVAGEGALSSVCLRPDANGATIEWDVDFGSNYQQVDEDAPDYFSTFVYSNGMTVKVDLYSLTSSGLGSGTIKGVTVKVVGCAFGGDGYLKGAIRTGDSNFYHGSELTVGSSWEVCSWSWAKNPDTGLAWTIPEIEALQAGMRGHCSSANATLNVTQVYVEVSYEATLPTTLLCFDGSAWHNLGSLDSGGKCLGFSAKSDRLWINDYDASAANHNTRYMKTQERSFLPANDYPTAGTHSLYISRIDAGLKVVDKCLKTLFMHTNNCISTRYIKVYYRTTGETWIELGTVTQSPLQELDLANVVGKYMDLRFDFVTDVATETPVLEAYAVKHLARPPTIYGYTLTLDIGNAVLRTGRTVDQAQTGRALRSALYAARDSAVPITVENLFNESRQMIVTALNISDARRTEKGYDITGNVQVVYAD